jgi:tetratricopeptide (TPR) repeat protein
VAGRVKGAQYQAVFATRYADFLRTVGRYDEAFRYLEETVDLVAKAYGKTHDKALFARWELAIALIDEGRLAAARREVERALRLAEEGRERLSTHTDLLGLRGLLQHEQGDTAAALVTFREVLKQYEAQGLPDASKEVSLHGMGLVQLRLGNMGAAREFLERALKVRSHTGPFASQRRAETAFALAQAMDRTPGGQRRACDLAREAVALLQDDSRGRPSPGRQATIARARRWIARQRCTPQS